MSEDENFLTRWSRRKHATREDADVQSESRVEKASNEVASADPLPVPPPFRGRGPEERTASPIPQVCEDTTAGKEHGGETGGGRLPSPERGRGGEGVSSAPEFDVSTLPSLESITAATDIRPFLAPGVPQTLRSAALRRAWSADPAIRDFIGLAENAWDFTAPGAIPGFGTLTAAEVARAVACFTQSEAAGPKPQAAAPNPETPAPSAENVGVDGPPPAAPVQPEPADLAESNLAAQATGADDLNVARRQETDEARLSTAPAEDPQPDPASARHGTAMPH
jgi:hypothetical protein